MYINNFKVVEDDHSSIEEKKKYLRIFMKERRGENVNRDIKELLMCENFLKMSYMNKKSFFVYLSFSSEASTDYLIEQLQKLGKKIYSPRVLGEDMFAVEYGDDFNLSNYGIREPIGNAFEDDIDVAVIPLLAVDRIGNRLGYGGGYYDKYLKKHKNTVKVGYCYDFQIISKVPFENWDIKLDFIVTDKQIIQIK